MGALDHNSDGDFNSRKIYHWENIILNYFPKYKSDFIPPAASVCTLNWKNVEKYK